MCSLFFESVCVVGFFFQRVRSWFFSKCVLFVFFKECVVRLFSGCVVFCQGCFFKVCVCSCCFFRDVCSRWIVQVVSCYCVSKEQRVLLCFKVECGVPVFKGMELPL